jgi:hypothetical protein
MLLDQAEKTKNPLKKAIKRRNAKTVTFTAPTYVEASDNDYSSEEEDGEGDLYAQGSEAVDQQAVIEEDASAAVEPLRTKAEVRDVRTDSEDTRDSSESAKGQSDNRASDEFFEGKTEGTSRSRNGTVRNTDSFFKDDTVETRKITLTPNLLRDDSSQSTTRTSNESSKEIRQRSSLDKLEKEGSFEKTRDEKKKKDKKEKDKKPGMLSGLFKRKDKKSKGEIKDEDIDELIMGKRSNENTRESSPSGKESVEIATSEEQTTAATNAQLGRTPSKLHKQPPSENSPTKPTGVESRSLGPQQPPAEERPLQSAPTQTPSMRLVQSEMASDDNQNLTPSTSPTIQTAPLSQTESKPSGLSKIIRSDSKPEKTKKVKSREVLDEFSSRDSSLDDDSTNTPGPQAAKQGPQRPVIPGAFPDSYVGTPATEVGNTPEQDRLSESPVHVSPVDAHGLQAPALVIDTSSQEEHSSPVSSPSPELVESDPSQGKRSGASDASLTPTPVWNDAQLRTFFEDDGDIRDLLVVVYDKSGVVPAGPDHPIAGKLFKEENAKLADITQVSPCSMSILHWRF